MAQGYYPKIDSSPKLDSEGVTTFQELIGILRWAVEVGQVDFIT